jgi:hypothetical protein
MARWPGRDSESETTEIRAQRWTLRVIAILLLLQGALLAAIVLVRLTILIDVGGPVSAQRARIPLDTALLLLLLGTMAVYVWWTALCMWLARRSAWLRAMIAQGILLIFSLSSYLTRHGGNATFAVMLSCIILVLYLNTNHVRLAFQSGHLQR